MRIAVGADHAGYSMKQELVEELKQSADHEVTDLGTDGPESVDYPEFAEAVGRAIQADRADRGILICGSGVGVSVAANKMNGIRAGLCHDTYSAHQGVEHDDMNVLVMGSRVIGPAVASELMWSFLPARFSGEPRHRRRLEKVMHLEQTPDPP